jgi:hypothetical protein
MLGSSIRALALFVGLSAAAIYPPDVVDRLADLGISKLKDYLAKNPTAAKGGCTLETAAKRKEWFGDTAISQIR